MKLSELTARLRDSERILAPGSETDLWGDYCEDMRQRVGQLPYDDSEHDPDVPENAVEYWLRLYEYKEGLVFRATHVITREDEGGREIEVMLCDDGVPYTFDEWTSETQADYQLTDEGEWLFQGRAFTGSVRRIP